MIVKLKQSRVSPLSRVCSPCRAIPKLTVDQLFAVQFTAESRGSSLPPLKVGCNMAIAPHEQFKIYKLYNIMV